MRRMVFVLGVVLAVTLAAGTALAQPGKNQITSSTSSCSDGETYTFTINAMGKAGKLEETTNNLIIKSYSGCRAVTPATLDGTAIARRERRAGRYLREDEEGPPGAGNG